MSTAVAQASRLCEEDGTVNPQAGRLCHRSTK
jgi:hypothetical protein